MTPFAPATVRIEFIDGFLPSDDLVRQSDPAVRADVGRSRKPACLHSIKRGAAGRDDLQDLLFVQHAARPGHIFIPLVFSRLSSVIGGSHNPNILLAAPPAAAKRDRGGRPRKSSPDRIFRAFPRQLNWTNE